MKHVESHEYSGFKVTLEPRVAICQKIESRRNFPVVAARVCFHVCHDGGMNASRIQRVSVQRKNNEGNVDEEEAISVQS